MNIDNMKNMVILKNLPSNIVDEAIVILKPNIKLRNLDVAENKTTVNKRTKNQDIDNPKKYIINEAEMIINSYISNIEKEKRDNVKVNKKMENKYKRLRIASIVLGIMLLFSFLIR